MAQILVVDDEEILRMTVKQALQTKGHTVHEACDGDKALKMLSEQKVDLVVTDIIMPNREGLETIQEVRMNWPEIKIIAMSGGGRIRNTGFLDLARKVGAHAVLQKPFSMSDLRVTVGRVLDEKLWQGQ